MEFFRNRIGCEMETSLTTANLPTSEIFQRSRVEHDWPTGISDSMEAERDCRGSTRLYKPAIIVPAIGKTSVRSDVCFPWCLLVWQVAGPMGVPLAVR
jgi:hypothetical protein